MAPPKNSRSASFNEQQSLQQAYRCQLTSEASVRQTQVPSNQQQTPSNCAPTKTTLNKHNCKPTRVLTNFSIDSIIGHDDFDDSNYEIDPFNSTTSNPTRREQPDSKRFAVEIGINETKLECYQNDKQLPQGLQAKKFRPKNFQCPVCNLAFSNNGQLKNHVRIHTGERPFKCNQANCDKTFTRNEELTRHKLIHTGVRPHTCPHCCKRFGRKDHLKKHVRTHERRKLRKRCFVSCSSAKRSTIGTNELHEQRKANMSSANHAQNLTDLYGDRTRLMFGQPPVTFAQTQLALHSRYPPTSEATVTSMTAITAAAAAAASASCITQQLAATQMTTKSEPLQLTEDYWQKWYDFLDIYQRQPAIDQTDGTKSWFR